MIEDLDLVSLKILNESDIHYFCVKHKLNLGQTKKFKVLIDKINNNYKNNINEDEDV